VRDLEESGELPGEKGSRQRERRQESREKTIIEICKRFGILSQSASYIAVEEREEKDRTTGELLLRRIPALVTIGWHGMGRVVGAPPSGIVCKMCEAPSIDMDIAMDIDAISFSRVAPEFGKSRDKKMEILMHILSLQKAGAGIEMDDKLAVVLGLRLNQLQKTAELIEISMPVDKVLLLSTAILLVILQLHFGNVSGMWTAVVRKSRDWLNDVMKRGNPRIRGIELLLWAREFVNSSISI
jgi:hypothetical protein